VVWVVWWSAALAGRNRASADRLADAKADAARLLSLGGSGAGCPDFVQASPVNGWLNWAGMLSGDGWLESRAAALKAIQLVEPLLREVPSNFAYLRRGSHRYRSPDRPRKGCGLLRAGAAGLR